ncbi:DoxX family protein [Paenibacillus chondroitinus]|uniref:DoxX family protein n=1 Tax=Paenibacillus chondroitinus TaxID=59842 RepID=A0ABU6D9G5_9BACL|nr:MULTISPECIES: DoxX family protein [Paenibacillus]MCY9659705.1 DoxX family protein [Paenibacillus anseongense]MEB4794116.1 DoxX family protein [Paenibacillus chondroitinus]
MKKITIPYWIFTALVVLFMGMGAIGDTVKAASAVELFKHLGYPDYLLPFLGIAKILGVIAILIPGFPRIKEWAYAGLIFDLTGAVYSTIAVDGFMTGLGFLPGYIIIAGSYMYYHKRQKAGMLSQTNQVKHLEERTV